MSPAPESRAPRWSPWLPALLLLGAMLLRLGAAPLVDVDEGAFGEASREMLAGGDWSRTTLNGEPRWDKPILVYWLQAGAMALLGRHEFALRLPSVLAAWGWVLATAMFARPRWGGAAALGAGAVLASGLGVALIGRAATADALLNLWLALAGLDLWRHLEAAPGSAAARQALRRTALWIGLGLLTKGPIALIVPGAAALVFIATHRSQVPAGTRLRGLLGDGTAWALMLAVALPWYALMLAQHGQAFVDGFLVRHNLSRYQGTLEGHGGSLGYYLLVLPLLMLPWTPLLVQLLRRARALWREPLAGYLLGWAGFVILFFSLSGTKLPHYALYGLTPLALLAGRMLAASAPGEALPGALLRLQQALLVLLAPLLAGVALALQTHAERIADPLYRALLGAPTPSPAPLAAGALLAAAAAALCLTGPRSRWGEPARLAAAALCGLLWFHGQCAPWWGERLQGPVRDLARQAQAQPGAPAAVQWGLHLPSFAFHLDRPVPRRAPQPGELALVRSDQLEALARQAGWRAPPLRLAERSGLSLVQRPAEPQEPVR